MVTHKSQASLEASIILLFKESIRKFDLCFTELGIFLENEVRREKFNFFSPLLLSLQKIKEKHHTHCSVSFSVSIFTTALTLSFDP